MSASAYTNPSASAHAPAAASSKPSSGGGLVRLDTACAQRGVTEEQVKAAGITLDWRIMSGGGNLYALVDDAAVADLQRRLQAQAAAAAHQAELLAELGAEGVAKLQREAEEAKQATAAAELVALQREKQVFTIQTRLEELLHIVNNTSNNIKPAPVQGHNIHKTDAKREWFLNDASLELVDSTKHGRTVLYALPDVIAAAEQKHITKHKTGGSLLWHKLQKRGESQTMGQYVAYLQHQLLCHHHMSPELVAEARRAMAAALQEQVRQSQQILAQHEQRLDAFQSRIGRDVFGDAADDGNDDEDENAAPLPSKRAKTEQD